MVDYTHTVASADFLINLQHYETCEVRKGVVWYVSDAVESQRESLKIPLVSQRADRDLRQVVVVQPEVAQLL